MGWKKESFSFNHFPNPVCAFSKRMTGAAGGIGERVLHHLALHLLLHSIDVAVEEGLTLSWLAFMCVDSGRDDEERTSVSYRRTQRALGRVLWLVVLRMGTGNRLESGSSSADTSFRMLIFLAFPRSPPPLFPNMNMSKWGECSGL